MTTTSASMSTLISPVSTFLLRSMMEVRVCVCVCVCVCVRHELMCVCVCVCAHVCVFVCMYVDAYVKDFVCTHAYGGLPLASILRRSLGLPARTFRGSLASLKGLTCASWTADTGSNLFCQTADTYWIHLALARQLKKSRSNLCYISWTTDIYVGQLIHAGSNQHQLDNSYMLDLTYISCVTNTCPTTDSCWI